MSQVAELLRNRILEASPFTKAFLGNQSEPNYVEKYRSARVRLEQKMALEIGEEQYLNIIQTHALTFPEFYIIKPAEIETEENRHNNPYRRNLVTLLICIGYELGSDELVELFLKEIGLQLFNSGVFVEKFSQDEVGQLTIVHLIQGLLQSGAHVRQVSDSQKAKLTTKPGTILH